MTYSEASRQAEEDARWIRNAKIEMEKRAERLAKCQAIIAGALTVEVVREPEPTDDPPAAERVVAFVHPADEPVGLYAILETERQPGALNG